MKSMNSKCKDDQTLIEQSILNIALSDFFSTDIKTSKSAAKSQSKISSVFALQNKTLESNRMTSLVSNAVYTTYNLYSFVYFLLNFI